MRQQEIETELRRRAAAQLERTHLVVDYYRIRRKVVYELPLRERPLLTVEQAPVADLGEYPWEIWLLWEVEERLAALGWAAEWFGDKAAQALAQRELHAIAGWPTFVPPQWHGLSIGHYLRLICTARQQWGWVDADLRQRLEERLSNAAKVAAEWFTKTFGPAVTRDADVAALAAGPDSFHLVHNIKVIALLGFACAANVMQMKEAAYLNDSVRAVLRLLFYMRDQGLSEAAAYDGYTLDFLAYWLETLPAVERQKLLNDSHWQVFFHESLYLTAPGSVVNLVELSDVEPVQMPFHVTPQARLQRWQPDGQRTWYLQRCPVDRLRVDALACLRDLPETPAPIEPPSGALDALYARVLRSGWQADDLAVAVATSASIHGHIHKDFGSICIGTEGRWILSDPGYQQYMESSERRFTMGPRAHNAPLINAQSMQKKIGHVLAMEKNHLALDLTDCYLPEACSHLVLRDIWLIDKTAVVVADRVSGAEVRLLEYHWHGHPQAAWSAQNTAAGDCPAALIYWHPNLLWISSPNVPAITGHDIHRQSGSRGHLTLSLSINPAPAVVWWVFSLADKPHDYTLDEQRKSLTILGHTCRFSPSSPSS